MAQPIENNLRYDISGKGSYYIDVMQGLTVLNQKKYDQTKSRKPLAAILSIRQNTREFETIDIQTESGEEPVLTKSPQSSHLDVMTLKTNWMVRNSVVKLGSAWRDQMRNAGVRLKDLPKYGREINLFMDEDHKLAWEGGTSCLLPSHQTVGFGGVEADDGTKYKFFPGIGEDALFEPFAITVPGDSPTATPDTYVMYMSSDKGAGDQLGGGNDFESVIWNYMRSRRSQEEVQDEEELGTEYSNANATIFRRLESALGDATEEIDATYADYGENRPYLYETDIVANRGRLDVHHSTMTVIAPLGLLNLETSQTEGSTDIIITVEGIVEM